MSLTRMMNLNFVNNTSGLTHNRGIIMYKIAIASGKGGTGKTTVSTNLSHYLALKHSVLLADMDVEEPDSHIFVKGELLLAKKVFKEVPTLLGDKCVSCGKCKQVCAFNAITLLGKKVLFFNELCHSCYSCVELCPHQAIEMKNQVLGLLTEIKDKELTFIEARLDIGQEQAVPLIKKSFQHIDENHPIEIGIIDSPPGSSCPVVETVKNCDYVFLVTEPSPFGLNDLKIAVETVKLLKKDFSIIINKDDGEENIIREYCRKENIDLLAAIPEKQAIAEYYSSGSLIYDKDEDFLTEIQKIEEKVVKLLGRK